MRRNKVFIASYPRSGNTWMRFLVANYFNNDPVTFENIGRLVPDMHQSMFWRFHNAIAVKTHSPYRTKFGRSIYLVRDPRSVAISYYDYQIKRCMTALDFNSWLIRWVVYGDKWGKWDDHVESWLNEATEVVKYRDIIENQSGTLHYLIETIFEVEPTFADIQKAVRQSDFNRMRKMEEKASAIQLIRKADPEEWMGVLTDNQKDLIIGAFGKTMEKLGYL